MSDCCCGGGGGGMVEGGTIKGSDIISSAITGSSFNAGTLSSVAIQNLTSLDDNSARVICEAFVSNLTPAQLQTLADKIMKAITPTGTRPGLTEEPSLPTKMFGKRTALLGEPERWLTIDGSVIPCYSKD